MDGFQLPDGIFYQQTVGCRKTILVQYGIDLILQVEHFSKGLARVNNLSETLGHIGAGFGYGRQRPGLFHPHDRKSQHAGKQYTGEHHDEDLPGVFGADILPERLQAEEIGPELFPEFQVKIRARFKMSFSVHFQGLYFPVFSSG